jgi:polyhydroxybutyrate depolymerase
VTDHTLLTSMPHAVAMRSFVLVLVTGLTLAGCGSGNDVSSAATAVATATTPTMVAAPTTPTTAATTTITAAAEATTTAVRLDSVPCPAAPAGDSTLTFNSSGGERTALVHVPATYTGATVVPLIIDFHGHGGNARNAQSRHGFDALAAPLGAITVYGQGLRQLDGGNGWATGAPKRDSGEIDDVKYTNDLLDILMSTYCIDSDRIWATGHSNGGGMTALLACDAADRIDAFAAVSAAIYQVDECTPARPVPFLEIHGLDDPVVPYNGGGGFSPIIDIVKGYAERNGCAPTPVIAGDRWMWTGCAAPVEHIAIPGQGHQYPDQAAGLVMDFFTSLAT